MKGWLQTKLQDIATHGGMVDGPFGSNLPASAYVEFGIPVIRGVNLSLGRERFNDFDYVFVAEETANKLKRSLCKPDDIIFTKKGTLGQTGIVPRNGKFQRFLLSSNQMRVRIDKRVADPLYVYYFVSSRYGQMRIQADAMTAGVPKINLGYLRGFQLLLPALTVQQKIAAVLSLYDELIDNSKRRIQFLEKLAEEIYREWFVRLRFPGHENVRVVKGVPCNWEVRTLGSFANEIKRGVKKKDLADEEKYVGLEHIPRHSIALRTWTTADTVESNKLLFQEHDILFGKIRPYLHKVAIAHFSGACSSDTIVLRPKEKCYEGYLLFTVFSNTFVELATVASKGTKMPRADWSFLKRLQLIVPHEELLERYQAQFDIVFRQIVNLLNSNQLLSTSRDLLLPRLISGKLSVENLDIQFPPGMMEEVAQNSDPTHHA